MVNGTAALFTSDATSATTFSVVVAAASLLFFITSEKPQRCRFLVKKAAALQRSI